jgi:hypothetical protein
MGSFWGMDQAGREAEGWPREYGAYSSDAFKNWLKRSDSRYAAGEAGADWARGYQENRANQGIGSVGQIDEYGRQIMPGVDEYVSNKKGRIQDATDRFSQLPGWQDTMAKIDAANEANRRVNSDNLSYIDQTRNYALRDIADTYDRGVGNEGETYGKNVGDLTDRYNDLRKNNADTYGRLGASAEDTYSTSDKNLEMLRPGSEFNIAQTARSFAPQMAAAAGRMRRMGVDPNSPQAATLLARVETARSRAMDDAAGEGTDKYVGAKNTLLGERQAARERLGTGELGNEIGLSTDQGTGLRGENVRHSGTLSELDRARSGAAIGTQNTAMDRITQNQGVTMEINDQDAKNAAMRKAMATQDWDTMNQLQGMMSDAELEAIGLHRDMFNAGMGYRSADLAERNAGAATVGDYGYRDLGNAQSMGGTALNYGSTAEDAYKTAYGYEAPKAGWGVKALSGVALAGLDKIAPGAGSAIGAAITPAVNSAVGGAPPQGSYGAPQQYGYNPQNPYGQQPYNGGFVPNQPTPTSNAKQMNVFDAAKSLYNNVNQWWAPKTNAYGSKAAIPF